MVFSAHPNYPPFHWEQAGKIVGASVDQAQIILDELNISYESRYAGPWKRVLFKAQQGQIDLILGLKNVPERRPYLAFSESPFYQNPVSVFVAKGKEFEFHHWSDLIDRKGTLNTGDRHGEQFDAFISQSLNTQRITGLKTNFDLLVKGRTQYFITGLFAGRTFLAKYPDNDKVTYLPNPVVVSPVHHGFSKKSECTELIPYFNKRLHELKEEGITTQLIEKNLEKWKGEIPLQPEKTTLKVGLLLASQGQGIGYRELFTQFEKEHPNIDINFSVYNDAQYKQKVAEWSENQEGPDVFYWQAGERLFELVEQNSVRSLDFLRDYENWDEKFPQTIIQQLEYDDHIYGLPFSFYQWGFYYKKSLFDKLGLQAPETWDAFLDVAKVLTDNGMDAIAIGTKNDWPAAAWFDYLNLRMNGLAFYQALLNGQVSYTDPKVRYVLQAWKSIIDQGYFHKGHEKLTWSEAIPLLYHEDAGITLIGNFVEKKIPHELHDNIGFFPFPVINQNVPRFELMPTEIFVLSRWSTKLNESLTLLKFLSKPQTQLKLANGIGYIPATTESSKHISPMSMEGVTLLNKSEDIMQYFDRDTNQAFSKEAIQILSDFLLKPDIEKTITALENERLKTFHQHTP
ncbi:hypothetical protein GCM10022277_28660 [Litoribacillus peritrichatus]|uniref:Solute-binding protein family 3/N-terminal domain-containing protein n=1 Tax=Litoribacillus peritrichatus TaxID=718191 RepID=A0ABP7MU19_9GAMM